MVKGCKHLGLELVLREIRLLGRNFGLLLWTYLLSYGILELVVYSLVG